MIKNSNNMNLEIQKLIDQMVDNNVSALMEGINSNIPILNLNAIIFGSTLDDEQIDIINDIINKKAVQKELK